MNILIVTQHFPPERGAVRRLYDFSRYFVRAGHNVAVLTGMPNYPDGIVPPAYKGKFFCVEEVDGVKIYRSWLLPASNTQPTKRMVGFITFLITGLINSFRIKQKFDVVLASTPPVTTPLMGWILSKLRRATFIIEVRDLQPESSEMFGNLNQSLFTRMVRKVVHSLYHRANRIVSVTDGISSYLTTIGIPANRIATIKSGVGNEFLNSNADGIRTKFGWEEKFLVLYAGTIGWAHSLETIVEAARQLTGEPDIHFVFVGDGQKRDSLTGMVRDYGLKNVSFIGTQPLESIPYYLKACDVLVASLHDVPVSAMALPSKLFEYMASGRPILFGSRSGEAVAELEQAGGALKFSTDSPDQLSDLILNLRDGKIDGRKLGQSYYDHVQRNHHREKWASEYLSFIQSSVDSPEVPNR